MWLPKERRYLLWVPLADLCGGLHACPGNIVRDSAPSDGTMSNVHTTYPRMGWSSSHSKLCGTRTVAVFKERVGRARPWEFGVRRARSGVPTLVSRRG